MLSTLSTFGAKVWDIISFMLPLMKAISYIAQQLEQLEPDDDNKYGEEEKEIAVNIVLKLYDIVNETTEEDLPISKEVVEKHAGDLVDIVVKILNMFNIFK